MVKIQDKWKNFTLHLSKNFICNEAFATKGIGFKRWTGNVLDVGCGPGWLSHGGPGDTVINSLKNKKIKSYTGVDIDKEFIKHFKHRVTTLPLEIRKNIKLKVMNACNMKNIGKYDFIQANYLYDHLKDPDSFLDGIKKTMKKDCLLFMNEHYERMDLKGKLFDTLCVVGDFFFRPRPTFQTAPHLRWSMLKDVEKKLKEHNFKIVKSKKVKRGWYVLCKI